MRALSPHLQVNQRVHSAAPIQEKDNGDILPTIEHGQSFDIGLGFCGFRFFGRKKDEFKGARPVLVLWCQRKGNVMATEICL